jgi:hypothetical protein
VSWCEEAVGEDEASLEASLATLLVGSDEAVELKRKREAR